jgi:glycosyltransferase involved in cell wall biosynthesis
MFYEKKDKHKFYDFVEAIFEKSKYEIGVIKTKEKTLHFKGYLSKLRFLLLLWDVFYIPFAAYKLWNKDFIFLREFTSPLFCISGILLFPLRKKLLLNVNHNLQRFEHRILHRLSIKFIDFLGFSFFIFEYKKTPFNLQNQVVSIPFRLQDIKLPISKKTKPTIGIIGAFRKEKQMEKILNSLLTLNKKTNDFNVLFACDNQRVLDSYNSYNVSLLNTRCFDNYNAAINSVDILIFNYNELDYKIRHSGVLTDAIFRGKIVIAPDYPLFREQLSTPERIGFTFRNLDSLEESVNDAIDFYHSPNIQDVYSKYFEYRNLLSVSSKLNHQLILKS